jgi:predicted nucleic acid-binding Zn ribbon protein
MLESKDDYLIRENNGNINCYNCGSKITNANLKYCHNCNMILNPNDLKWRNSFIFFLSFLCLIPIIIAVISSWMSQL